MSTRSPSKSARIRTKFKVFFFGLRFFPSKHKYWGQRCFLLLLQSALTVWKNSVAAQGTPRVPRGPQPHGTASGPGEDALLQGRFQGCSHRGRERLGRRAHLLLQSLTYSLNTALGQAPRKALRVHG